MTMPTMPIRFGKWGHLGVFWGGTRTGVLWGAAQPTLVLRGVPHRR